jgi:hypothetical protein
MTDTKAIIKELCEYKYIGFKQGPGNIMTINANGIVVDNKPRGDIIINDTEINILKENIIKVPNNKYIYILQYILSKIPNVNNKILLLENKEFMNLIVNNITIMHNIIIYIMTNISPNIEHSHANSRATSIYHHYSSDNILKIIELILKNKKIILKKEDYKTFHDTAYKYLHNKCDDVYELYNTFTKYECEDMLFNDDIIENDVDKKDKEIERLKLEMKELKKFYINS